MGRCVSPQLGKVKFLVEGKWLFKPREERVIGSKVHSSILPL